MSHDSAVDRSLPRLQVHDENLPTRSSSQHSNGSPVTPSFSTASSTASKNGLSWMNSLQRPRTSPGPRVPQLLFKRSHLVDDDTRRDSALTSNTMTTSSTAGRESPVLGSVSAETEARTEEPSLPAIVVSGEQHGRSLTSPQPTEQLPIQNLNRGSETGIHRTQEKAGHDALGEFRGITTDIPSGEFENLFSAENLGFSKRGSVLLGGRRANGTPSKSNQAFWSSQQTSATPRQHGQPRPRQRRSVVPTTRVLSADEEMLSQRVRSMYEYGNESAASFAGPIGSATSIVEEAVAEEDEMTEGRDSTPSLSASPQLNILKKPHGGQLSRNSSVNARRQSFIEKEPTEAAGGMEDWQDIESGEVDRYGFIVPKKIGSRTSSIYSNLNDQRLHRVTTSLQMASDTPRRKRTVRRAPSNARSSGSAPTAGTAGTPRRKISKRSQAPTGSIYSNGSASASTISTFRVAANRLPHNRERRWVDEASDMLTLPPGLADVAEQQDDGKAALAMKRKEWEREEKWRKMGKIAKKDARGGGMNFDFDTRDSKLINRTWKGIPDRWRASAWWAFLEASAKKRGVGSAGGESAEELVAAFYDAQEQNCVDDVQIDVDVPRTISSHIMFRRRYRGGQRLLFRVLHALSLYLPEIGYVQGMAALAATLLCYYDEENCFVMMVRLWQLRGLNSLYRSGFGGLMEALEEFEKHWLDDGDVAKKLKEFGITPTAYGTRWYLTLFNYSIPFPAQLRVWDVFMLLGDCPSQSSTKSSPSPEPSKQTPPADLDVLHATSAALIDAEREILLDSDFENAMKVLTSWIPIKDEDFLMRVARAEYRKIRKKLGKSV